MGMTATCPECGHSAPSDSHRGGRLGNCPKCGTPMRAHTAGKAKGRYICPIAGHICTLGLGSTIQLTEPMRLVFQPGWDYYGRDEPDPERPGWMRRTRYHRGTPEGYEQEKLNRAAGRVFGPGCVISDDYSDPYAEGDPHFGRARLILVAVPGADPATWFVNEPVTYKKCAACPRRIPATDANRMSEQWTSGRRHSASQRRSGVVNPGPHPAGTYACSDCRGEPHA